jgi:cell wall-associated NlpC family hydrolase
VSRVSGTHRRGGSGQQAEREREPRHPTGLSPALRRGGRVLSGLGLVGPGRGREGRDRPRPIPPSRCPPGRTGPGRPVRCSSSPPPSPTSPHAVRPLGGAVPPSRYNPHDAIHAAAAYLCDSGAPAHLRRALYAYNHSQAYVTTVLARAAAYRARPGLDRTSASRTDASAKARLALAYAHGQLGLPYLWGGNGPDRGDPGFDCSGLTTAAYAAAGITLPRTAHTQYRAGPLLPPGTPLQAGDLLFFGTPTRVHHVGIATGHGTMMIHAPRRGTTIRVQDARDLHDYLAASRPTRQ